MYDDDSENSQKGFGKNIVGNVAKGASGGVKRVARGTRRMSLMAAGNVKNVASNMPGNVKKAAAGTVKVGVGAVGNVARGAENVITGKGKKKKKKKKKKKDKSSRGRSESPRRTSNSKPPVTKIKGIKSMFSPKRWRSASPAINRKKNKQVDTEEEELEPLPPVAPDQTQQRSFQAPASNGYGGDGHGGGGGGGGGYNGVGAGGYDQQQGGGWDPMQSRAHDPAVASIGASHRSMSSADRMQRQQQQELIERDNAVPFFSGFMHSSHFAKFCDTVFERVDTNGDNVVDETELYAGLLLMHLKLGSFLGPAACRVSTNVCCRQALFQRETIRLLCSCYFSALKTLDLYSREQPLSRERCQAMFQKFDSTGTGGLDQTEFRRVIMVLFANVLARVCIQFALTIFIVPLLAKSVRNFLTIDTQWWWDYWTKPKYLRRLGEEFTLDDFIDWKVTSYPSSRRTFFTRMYRFFRIGSDEFWETFPLTFLTIILGLVIAPLMLYAIDDLFHFIAERKEIRRVAPRTKKR